MGSSRAAAPPGQPHSSRCRFPGYLSLHTSLYSASRGFRVTQWNFYFRPLLPAPLGAMVGRRGSSAHPSRKGTAGDWGRLCPWPPAAGTVLRTMTLGLHVPGSNPPFKVNPGYETV